ncbi:helix-turn-helix domain-containing protein [Ectobacillus panaciterrae]|uniref:helix-turn-helix domain-containing protein n=1 Tax=Ectobacillus panaciterrae TaxID=363872 RepID=UPI00048E3E57|nr:helix-turn-helix domain-containing protein [Ectobacillus panaciterrae]
MRLLHVILYGLKQINGERTSASVYHLLKGKRSSQTLQDGTIYHLSFLFGVYKKLDRQIYDEQINVLLTENWIKQIQENTYILTNAGEEELKHHQFPKHLHGLQYGELGEWIWKRLALLVQTVSHLQERSSFLPVQQELEVTAWVKRFLLAFPYSREQLRDMLYRESEGILLQVTEQEATVFVLRLTGAERIGYTKMQLAQFLRIDAFHVHLLFLGAVHFIVKEITKQQGTYPLLEMILPAADIRNVLSISTQKTYMHWKQGKSMDEIAAIRGLKRNTIEDHIVEIAMNEPDFPIDSFLPQETIETVKEAISRMQTRKLRVLKQHLGEEINYFAIRLVLAALGGAYEA